MPTKKNTFQDFMASIHNLSSSTSSSSTICDDRPPPTSQTFDLEAMRKNLLMRLARNKEALGSQPASPRGTTTEGHPGTSGVSGPARQSSPVSQSPQPISSTPLHHISSIHSPRIQRPLIDPVVSQKSGDDGASSGSPVTQRTASTSQQLQPDKSKTGEVSTSPGRGSTTEPQPGPSRDRQPNQPLTPTGSPKRKVSGRTNRESRFADGADSEPPEKMAKIVKSAANKDAGTNRQAPNETATTSQPKRKKPRKAAEPQRRVTTVTRMIKTIREIRKLQESTNMLIPRLPFTRLVREITHEIAGPTAGYKYTPDAVEALQSMAEHYLTVMFSNANLVAAHARRVTVMPKDLNILHLLGLIDLT